MIDKAGTYLLLLEVAVQVGFVLKLIVEVGEGFGLRRRVKVDILHDLISIKFEQILKLIG